ncbi:hypothetical protein [Bacillus sp. N1-1]|uniref:hypothetical protein n=1 Tax=Bacillus sp. N1-1 TaxID=2682541 RepID=UPI001316C5E7|nr:hypothetical protein [Bacillus sp. N1-1]QHA91009.1 hypothetical protein GNK04_06010 [Bacillus sp. N1-1]
MEKNIKPTLILILWNMIGLTIGYFIFTPIVEDTIIGLVIGLCIGATVGISIMQKMKSKS